MKYLITGTSGYVGKILSHHLRSHGHEVREILGRKDFKAALEATTSDLDVVIHAGCSTEFVKSYLSPDESLNVTNTRHLIAKLNSFPVKPYLLLISAAGTSGVSKDPSLRDENSSGSPKPFRSYDNTQYIQDKREQEKLISSYEGNSCILCLTTVFGKSMPQKTLSFYRSLTNKSIIFIPPGGTSFLSEEDLLSALNMAVAKSVSGRFIVSSGNATFEELFRVAIRAARGKSRHTLVRLPFFAKYLFLILDKLTGKFAVHVSTFGFKYYSTEKFTTQASWKSSASVKNLFENIF